MHANPSLAPDPTFVHCKNGIGIAEVGPVCVVLWRDAVVRWRFKLQRDALADTVRRNAGKAYLLCVVEQTAAPPNRDLRRASAEMLNSHGSALRGVCSVIDGHGFRCSVIRSVLSGMAYLVHGRELRKAFVATVDEAVDFLRPDLPSSVLTRIPAVVAQLRSTLSPAAEPFKVTDD